MARISWWLLILYAVLTKAMRFRLPPLVRRYTILTFTIDGAKNFILFFMCLEINVLSRSNRNKKGIDSVFLCVDHFQSPSINSISVYLSCYFLNKKLKDCLPCRPGVLHVDLLVSQFYGTSTPSQECSCIYQRSQFTWLRQLSSEVACHFGLFIYCTSPACHIVKPTHPFSL